LSIGFEKIFSYFSDRKYRLIELLDKSPPHGIEQNPLPLPMGEVAERSEDGKRGCNALSVTFGDSSPRGKAKWLYLLPSSAERAGSVQAAPHNSARSLILNSN
jgi:hypothetical protein